MAEEMRKDPEDGCAYTYDDLVQFYTGRYKKKVILQYWEEECIPLRKKRNKKAAAAVALVEKQPEVQPAKPEAKEGKAKPKAKDEKPKAKPKPKAKAAKAVRARGESDLEGGTVGVRRAARGTWRVIQYGVPELQANAELIKVVLAHARVQYTTSDESVPEDGIAVPLLLYKPSEELTSKLAAAVTVAKEKAVAAKANVDELEKEGDAEGRNKKVEHARKQAQAAENRAAMLEKRTNLEVSISQMPAIMRFCGASLGYMPRGALQTARADELMLAALECQSESASKEFGTQQLAKWLAHFETKIKELRSDGRGPLFGRMTYADFVLRHTTSCLAANFKAGFDEADIPILKKWCFENKPPSRAFVFIKPHAVTNAVKELVRNTLAENGVVVIREGLITAEEIDKKGLIDEHYGSIAMRAMRQKPADLTVQPTGLKEFEAAFGLSWESALEKGIVYNAVEGAEKLSITRKELGERFDKLVKKVDQIKLGGGLYCGKMDDIYVINGFYFVMRSAFTDPGNSIYYFVVDWSSAAMSWGDFRGKLLGATDPTTSAPGSLRNLVFKDWERLGLSAVPNMGDNGLHASASPFEALSEIMNWLSTPLADVPFGRAMLDAGVPQATIEAWTKDPTVTFNDKKTSVFDLFEDVDAPELLAKALKVQ
eukprot:NODE_1712_length_2396_cov_33.546937.p1 GENE.NODE_1712_length_2396_cov_33.546937~~NODE_1712_length_2396_cov_33.546937.p1  ORF type:complete len:702 (+),score=213.87 NODE_1712_length_2396_cov_33.546937:140-2107(+)